MTKPVRASRPSVPAANVTRKVADLSKDQRRSPEVHTHAGGATSTFDEPRFIPHRWLNVRECCRFLGFSVRYVQNTLSGNSSAPDETQAVLSVMKKRGGRWGAWGPDLERHIARIGAAR